MHTESRSGVSSSIDQQTESIPGAPRRIILDILSLSLLLYPHWAKRRHLSAETINRKVGPTTPVTQTKTIYISMIPLFALPAGEPSLSPTPIHWPKPYARGQDIQDATVSNGDAEVPASGPNKVPKTKVKKPVVNPEVTAKEITEENIRESEKPAQSLNYPCRTGQGACCRAREVCSRSHASESSGGRINSPFFHVRRHVCMNYPKRRLHHYFRQTNRLIDGSNSSAEISDSKTVELWQPARRLVPSYSL
ncbi:hypothetical protein CcaCcLH18_12371 [Colletotrichum camelliae]|nr:hypothetical protein CcaCcLH18_12371 [Colletotrichum camelliae]